MIVFDLDGTLADCEHRRHFVDPQFNTDVHYHSQMNSYTGGWKKNGEIWQPDWIAFYEACDEDRPIEPTISVLKKMCENCSVEIWSGRSESVREKTQNWFYNHIPGYSFINLKMRRVGDTTPDDILKEKWLDEAIAEGKEIDFVFDDRPKVIRMWQRRGIFVFNCCQHDKEF